MKRLAFILIPMLLGSVSALAQDDTGSAIGTSTGSVSGGGAVFPPSGNSSGTATRPPLGTNTRPPLGTNTRPPLGTQTSPSSNGGLNNGSQPPGANPGSPTPIVLVLDDKSGVTFGEKPVAFDIRAEGVRTHVSWPAGEVAFLVHDLNGNDVVDDGTELFGDATQVNLRSPVEGQPAFRKARHGCEALEQFDGNDDGVIDSADSVFQDLLLWKDENSDGKTQPGELTNLAKHGVLALDLACRQVALPGVPTQMEPLVSRYFFLDARGRPARRAMIDLYLHDFGAEDLP